ncbi:MAG: hypothetical protein ACYTFA_01185, partial [Planctomycetota bacterium]
MARVGHPELAGVFITHLDCIVGDRDGNLVNSRGQQRYLRLKSAPGSAWNSLTVHRPLDIKRV